VQLDCVPAASSTPSQKKVQSRELLPPASCAGRAQSARTALRRAASSGRARQGGGQLPHQVPSSKAGCGRGWPFKCATKESKQNAQCSTVAMPAAGDMGRPVTVRAAPPKHSASYSAPPRL
jgi:hypothetical protein